MAEKKKQDFYPLFNKKGKAGYYLDADKIHVYAMAGDPVAFVEKTAVFKFDKVHIGWYDDGWLRDLGGKCVAFTEPTGKAGPNPPKTKHPDAPGEKHEPPEKPAIEHVPDRPVRKAVWSDTADTDFFK